MALFDSWRPQAGLSAESDGRRFCPYSPQCIPLLLPSAAQPTATTTLPLFGAASAAASGSGLGAAADGQEAGSLSTAEARDVVLFAGGPVWGLDWCPAGTAAAAAGAAGQAAAGAAASDAAAAAGQQGYDYMAVSCHPPEAAHNVIGTPVEGPACIQVWELSHPSQQQQQQQQGGPRLPHMALGLAHYGGLAWHCQWCPSAELADDPSSSPGPGALPRLGLLAAALGDGSVRVWAVPHPRSAALQQLRQQQQQQQQRGAPLVLSLPPVAAVSSAALGGSLPSVVDWLPAPPHDLLAVGCWDGSVAVLRLRPDQQQAQQQQQQQQQQDGSGSSSAHMRGAELLLHFPADVLPLRTLRWMPPRGDTIDLLHRHVLLTGGSEGTLRVWDLRDPFHPIYSHILSSSTVALAADWTTEPLGILVAMEDASIRGVTLDSALVDAAATAEKKAMFSISWRGADMGALWALAVQPAMQLVAYGGEDGVVAAFQAEYEPRASRRAHHAPLSGWRLEGLALALRSPAQIEAEGGLFRGKVVERNAANLGAARLPEEVEAVHRVSWSRHGGGAAWLAAGGAAGLVRCQWIQPS